MITSHPASFCATFLAISAIYLINFKQRYGPGCWNPMILVSSLVPWKRKVKKSQAKRRKQLLEAETDESGWFGGLPDNLKRIWMRMSILPTMIWLLHYHSSRQWRGYNLLRLKSRCSDGNSTFTRTLLLLMGTTTACNVIEIARLNNFAAFIARGFHSRLLSSSTISGKKLAVVRLVCAVAKI